MRKNLQDEICQTFLVVIQLFKTNSHLPYHQIKDEVKLKMN